MVVMNQNFARRAASLIAFAPLAVLLWPLGAAEPDAGAGAKGRETPQALIATYDNAVEMKDWKTCFLCYDAKWRANLLSTWWTGIAMSHDEGLNAIVKKHVGKKVAGVDELAIPVVRSDTRMFKELRAFESDQKRFRDLPAFIDEISRYVDGKGQTPFQKLVDVKDIRVEGDTAVGHGKQSLPPPLDLPVQIHFCRIGGRWYLTIPDPPPPLSVSERARQLQAEVETLEFFLCCSGPAGEKTYDSLRMSVRPFGHQSPTPTHHRVHLTPGQANKLIVYLASEGFLEQALETGKQEIPVRQRGPRTYYYTLQVSTTNLQPTEDLGLKLYEDLGWGPGLVKRLEGLRGALDEEGARALDAIIAGLADERKENGGR